MPTPELTLVIPTYNEVENIEPILRRLSKTLEGVEWEAVFVDDDSPDGTANLVRALARDNPRLRCLQRIGRRGLASACIEGMASSSAPYLAVMDADLQHDESLLVQMLETLRRGETDLVVGSRYVSGGGVGEWDGTRRRISKFATSLGGLVLKTTLTDPMSGFFMIRHASFWEAARNLSGRGFKILLDLVASAPRPWRIVELPYVFKPRVHGESKLDAGVAWEYLLLLIDKLIGWLVPVRFLLFVLVGSTGAVLHVSILGAFYRVAGKDFWASQITASLCAMVLNFTLNNLMTYRDRQLKGAKLFAGLLLFVSVCSIGAFTSAQIAEYFFVRNVPWWLSGLMGAAVGSVWNYGVSSQFVWRRSKRVAPPATEIGSLPAA